MTEEQLKEIKEFQLAVVKFQQAITETANDHSKLIDLLKKRGDMCDERIDLTNSRIDTLIKVVEAQGSLIERLTTILITGQSPKS